MPSTSAPRTPEGSRPAGTLPARFDPRPIEWGWKEAWESARAFEGPARPRGSPFVLALPPPNVTGVLTVGHMLGGTVMDALVRRARMQGRPTLWIPGVDHAGLATQIEVRRRLSKQGIRFENLPREEALHQLELWKEEHEKRIGEQLRAAGFSIDWTRYRYTMDEGSRRATREAFVRLFDAGLIYRGERLVNWDPVLETAISDLEVTYSEEQGTLYTLLYAWADGTPGGIEVATARPETLFGDVAVAVNPDDARHAASVGREVRVPLAGRIVPVLADAAIDPSFGTGALKVTPRHDVLDYAGYERYPEIGLPPEIFDARARLSGPSVPPDYQGLDRDRARTRAVDALRYAGLLLREERSPHSVARSERSEAVVEPRLSSQWFVRMAPLAERAVRAVREGRIRIHPARWEATFFRWMEGIRDRCISRQILWGHPIPVYPCAVGAHEFATVTEPSTCPRCGSKDLTSDPDVLDTWFTSWMWPFLSLGWPERTADLTHYYPTSVLVTGRDIMFFWVARMMMAGLHFTDRVPFSDVVFTGMLRDAQGRRMSKHLGNSPDPMDVMAERGVDSMRFALLFPNPMEDDGPFGKGPLDGARNFLTKLWNVVRFATLHLASGTDPPASPPALDASSPLEDRWILSRYSALVQEVDRAMDGFEVSRAASALYQFLWHELADRYLEIVKDRLAGQSGPESQRMARAVLLFVTERSLRMLQPIAPHITEELWHALPHEGELLAAARWPAASELVLDPTAEGEMGTVLETVRLLRNLRSDEEIPAEATLSGGVRANAEGDFHLLTRERATVERLGRVAPLTILRPGDVVPDGVATRVAKFGECFLVRPSRSVSSVETLEREREKLRGLLDKTLGRLSDPGFRDRAPPAVVAEAEKKAEELRRRIERIDTHMTALAPREDAA